MLDTIQEDPYREIDEHEQIERNAVEEDNIDNFLGDEHYE